jgi:hypothetical protein
MPDGERLAASLFHCAVGKGRIFSFFPAFLTNFSFYYNLSTKQVWTPYGGWWATPAAWKRNTAIAHVGVFCVCAAIFSISSDKERRPIAPYKHIPSQMWCKHAKEDDPSLN